MIKLQDCTLQIQVMVGEQVYIRLFDTNHETGFYLPKGKLLSIDELVDVALDGPSFNIFKARIETLIEEM